MRRRHSLLDFAGVRHFVTTVTRERGDWFVDEVACREMLSIFENYREKFGLKCYGYVLMPDHLHAVLAQETDGALVPSLMENFKRLVSKQIPISGHAASTLWRDTYDDVPLPGIKAVRTRVSYVHSNPVRRGLVERPEDYPWSSAMDYWEPEIHVGIVKISFP